MKRKESSSISQGFLQYRFQVNSLLSNCIEKFNVLFLVFKLIDSVTCTAINSGILDNFQTSDNLGTKICNSNCYLPLIKKQQKWNISNHCHMFSSRRRDINRMGIAETKSNKDVPRKKKIRRSKKKEKSFLNNVLSFLSWLIV